MTKAYRGSCHCGAITYRYESAMAPASWPIRACQCSFCRAHDVVSTSEPDATIEFHAGDKCMLQKYRFALRTADFLLCRNCGTYVGAVIEVDGEQFGIINMRALTPAPDSIADARPISYFGENATERISRRRQRWSRVRAID